MTAYVVHFCKNTKCNNAWIGEDLTHVRTYPPKYKYCQSCCDKLGINFEQQPTPKQISSREVLSEYQKEKIAKGND